MFTDHPDVKVPVAPAPLRFKVYNRDADRTVTNKAAIEFINDIDQELGAGYGFAPFVGAGFSAPSGIPLVRQLRSYLHRCICMALGAEDSQEPDMRPWNPRTDHWPPFVDRDRADPCDWEDMVYQHLSSTKLKSKLENKSNPDLAILQEGFGAMAEWRTSLLFLSRLVGAPKALGSEQKGVLSLASPQQEIIDACFREVMKGKQPSLSHRMLGALSGLLRIDLVMTTNFDDLLERAFASTRNPLQVFEVHLGGSFPDWSAVSRVRSLIKLNGSQYSLRADYSLDDSPSELDKAAFLSYLSGSKPATSGAYEQRQSRNHLLVLGVSANERRTLSLIEHAWNNLDDVKVFWVCYSKDDVDRVTTFTESVKKLNSPDRSLILRYTDLGLLLLQIYQSVRHNLPPIGTVFPSISQVALPPLPSAEPDTTVGSSAPAEPCAGTVHREEFTDLLRRELREFAEQGAVVKPSERLRHKIVVATSGEKAHGVTSACGRVFRELQGTNVCLWIDMNDISSTDNLFEVLLETAYARLGSENWTPVYMAGEARPRAKEIRRLADSGNLPWIIFLNGRETPGTNTREPFSNDPTREYELNGWWDRIATNKDLRKWEDTSNCMEPLIDLLTELSGSKRISVVLLCYGESSEKKSEPAIIKRLRQRLLIKWPLVLQKDSTDWLFFDENAVAIASIHWTREKEEQRVRREWFLQALAMFQRSRLLATVWDACVNPSSEPTICSENEKTEWLDDLEGIGLLRRKDGGFIWLHARCRERLREFLRMQIPMNGAEGDELGAILREWDPQKREPEIHTRIATWYQKLLDATGSPSAVFETADHLSRAAESILRIKCEDGYEQARGYIRAACSLIKGNRFLIQTHGYSRGSCRRLEYIRDFYRRPQFQEPILPETAGLRKDIFELQSICTEIMRAIAREVGEDGKAYRRHKELRPLLMLRDIIDAEEIKAADLGAALLPEAGAQDESPAKDMDTKLRAWVRWWRWTGMLAIGSRSFAAAEIALCKALHYATTPDSSYPSRQAFALSLSDVDTSPLQKILTDSGLSQSLNVEILRILEQCVALLLLRHSARTRLAEVNRKHDDGDWERAMKKPLELISIGLWLVERVIARDRASDSDDVLQARWCKSRFLMHQSLAIVPGDDEDVFRETGRTRQSGYHPAMKALGDAETCLSISDPRRYRADLAMVELHRAEVRLRQANSIKIGTKLGALSFGQFCLAILQENEVVLPDNSWEAVQNRSEDKKENCEANRLLKFEQSLRDKYFDCDDKAARSTEMLLVRTYANDAMRFLDRAEPALRERRRNVWWTTWFFERRLRTITALLWSTVLETNAPIPFLGLEAAPRKTATMADDLLDDSVRMIRVDEYRLATVIQAYALCARGLQIRLLWDPTTVHLPARIERMHKGLQDALGVLEQVSDRREKAVGNNRYGKTELDIKNFVDSVRRDCVNVADGLLAFARF